MGSTHQFQNCECLVANRFFVFLYIIIIIIKKILLHENSHRNVNLMCSVQLVTHQMKNGQTFKCLKTSEKRVIITEILVVGLIGRSIKCARVNISAVLSCHSLACSSLECCCFHDVQPAVSILGSSPGRVQTIVHWIQVSLHCSCPCVARAPSRSFPASWRVGYHCLQRPGMVLVNLAAGDVSKQLESSSLSHLQPGMSVVHWYTSMLVICATTCSIFIDFVAA